MVKQFCYRHTTIEKNIFISQNATTKRDDNLTSTVCVCQAKNAFQNEIGECCLPWYLRSITQDYQLSSKKIATNTY